MKESSMKTNQSAQKRAAAGLSLIAALVITAASLVVWRVDAADEEDLSLRAFMRKKLDASSHILEGLTVEDADLIARGAKDLLKLSTAEKWQILVDSQYREHSSQFRATVKKLADAAEKGNFDNAALQWFDATKACIECHQDVRRDRAGKK
jgi:hypothetical protein